MSNGTGSKVRWPEIVYIVILVVLFVYVALWANAPRVGVLDLRRLTNAVGMDTRMAKDYAEKQKEAQQKLSKVQAQIADATASLNKELQTATGAKREELVTQLAAIQRPFLEEATAIRNDAQRHRGQVLGTFRRRIQPSLEKVSRRRHLDVVMDPSVSVLYATRRVDITDEVVKDCKPLFKPDLPLIDLTLLPARTTEEPEVPPAAP